MNEELARAIVASAGRLGTTPLDLGTVISYESRFKPEIWGGAGGKHFGFIQAGPEERERYGIKPGQTVSEQMSGVERYLVDRGFKPGMGLLDLYSTINAGRPGRYGASDAANGGMPGTVADKVANQMGGHRAAAQRLLGGILDQPSATVAPAQTAPMGAAPPSMALPMGAGSASDDAMMQALRVIAQRAQQDEAADDMPLIDFNFKQPAGIARQRQRIKRRG